MTEDVKKSKLREMYAYKAKLTEKLDELTKSKVRIDHEIEDTNKRLAGVLKGIEHIENRQLLITTHAIERYRERVNPDATEDLIKAHIITPQLLNMIATLGNGTYPVESFHVVVEDNKVITVITPFDKVKFDKTKRERSRRRK